MHALVAPKVPTCPYSVGALSAAQTMAALTLAYGGRVSACASSIASPSPACAPQPPRWHYGESRLFPVLGVAGPRPDRMRPRIGQTRPPKNSSRNSSGSAASAGIDSVAGDR